MVSAFFYAVAITLIARISFRQRSFHPNPFKPSSSKNTYNPGPPLPAFNMGLRLLEATVPSPSISEPVVEAQTGS